MDEVRIPPAGDPFTARRSPSTRHIRCTPEFIGLLEEDFGIPYSALHAAFMGVPREPQKEAIVLCEWASKTAEPARALLSWARKHQHGTFARPDDVGDE
jgi:hypothetical protein